MAYVRDFEHSNDVTMLLLLARGKLRYAYHKKLFYFWSNVVSDVDVLIVQL